MSCIEYFSSREIGKLVSILKYSGRQKGKLALCGLTGDAREVFNAMRLTTIFSVFDSVSEGVQAISK